MADSNILDRIVFRNKGQQQAFLLEASERLGLNWEELAHLVAVHPRTVRDWAREKNCISFIAAKTIAEKAKINFPRGTKVKKWTDHLAAISSKGGKALYKKYGRVGGDGKYRQEQWVAWWNSKGKYLPSPIDNQPLTFHVPLLSRKLAEFVGIMMGDGGITKYQLKITLHRYDDRLYSYFVKNLIRTLFWIEPKTISDKNALADTIIISRIKMVEYAVKKLGLVFGNKVQQQFDIPTWIKSNRRYATACVRGLFDTDGCVFTHKYTVNGKEYAYKKLAFASASHPLRLSVYDIWSNLDINCRFAGDKDVRIDSQRDVERYFKIIGSHNPKHLKRYRQ